MTTQVKITNVNGPKAIRIINSAAVASPNGIQPGDIQPGEARILWLHTPVTLAEVEPSTVQQPLGAGGPGEPDSRV